MTEALEHYESFEARALRMMQLGQARGDEPERLRQAEVIQFPLWPEPERAAPNAFLRSALFGVVKKGERAWIKDEVIASWTGASIRYKGEQLDQYDESVWLQLIHLHRVQSIRAGSPLRIYVRAFLRELGVSYGQQSRKALYSSLRRLRANAVSVEGPRGKHIGGLLVDASEDASGEYWTVTVDSKVSVLFVPGHYSRLDWQTRLALKADLAKWLHGYVATQATTSKHPHRIGMDRLRELSGSNAELKKFRFNVRKAMSELQTAKAVFRWNITAGDALEFVRRSKDIQEDP